MLRSSTTSFWHIDAVRGRPHQHDYKRNGAPTLFAALNVLDATVIGRNMQRHRHQEFIRFLNAINAEVPADKAVHVVLNNYAPHKHPKVRAWLVTSASPSTSLLPSDIMLMAQRGGWLLGQAVQAPLKRGVFHSVVDLQAAINRFLAEHNQQPKPFTWTADPDKIIAAEARAPSVKFLPIT